MPALLADARNADNRCRYLSRTKLWLTYDRAQLGRTRRVGRARLCEARLCERIASILDEMFPRDSLVASAQYLLDHPPAETVCARIHRIVTGQHKGPRNATSCLKVVQAVQADALFSLQLKTLCNLRIEEQRHEHELRLLLFQTLIENIALRSQLGEEISETEASKLVEMIRRQVDHLNGTVEAASLLTATYYDGRDVLLPDSRRSLEKLVNATTQVEQAVVAELDGSRVPESGGRRDHHVAELGRAVARCWVDLSRAEVLARLERTCEGEAIVRRLLSS